MRRNHDVLNTPLRISNANGVVQVIKKKPAEQSRMGASLTLDSIVNSIDAELIATGPSDKGPDRGSIVRHGQYVLWGFWGPVSDMTDEGKKLFVNTVVYTAKHANSSVMERRYCETRDSILSKLRYVERAPGYLNTMKRLVLPESLKSETTESIKTWAQANRPYLRADKYDDGSGRRRYRFRIDEYAKKLKMPNHTTGYIETCIENIEAGRDIDESSRALVRYTGHYEFGSSPERWRKWYADNRDYLFFSDCEGFVFKVDEEAKRLKRKSSDLRRWSSQTLDYRFDPGKPHDLETPPPGAALQAAPDE